MSLEHDGTDPLDPDSKIPKYLQIAEALQERIQRGEITGKVPSADRLMGEFHVARRTASAALKALRDDKVITYTPGLGHFVGEPPRDLAVRAGCISGCSSACARGVHCDSGHAPTWGNVPG